MPRPHQASNGEQGTDGARRSEGFPKSIRLRKRPDFLRVQGKGRRIVRASLVAVALRREDKGSPRFGLTVSKKVGNAVVRNRVKRALREALRRDARALTGVDVVFIARPSAAMASSMQLAAEVGEVLERLARPSSRSKR